MVGGSVGPPNGANADMEAGNDIPEAEDMLTVQRRIAEAERVQAGGKGDESSVIRTSFFETTSNADKNRKITIWQRFFRCQHHNANSSCVSAAAAGAKEVLVKPSVHPLA